MKRPLQNLFFLKYASVGVFLLLFFLVTKLSGQCEVTFVPAECNPANGAYITKNLGEEDLNFRRWTDPTVWTRLKGNPKHYTIPPPTTSTQFTQNTYIEIAAGHKVHLDQSLKFGNKLTLVVCGELRIDELIELPEILTVGANFSPDLDNNGELITENSFITFYGKVLFSGNTLTEPIGFNIRHISNTGDSTEIILMTTVAQNFSRTISINDLSDLLRVPLTLGSKLYFQAFASNLDGTGYGYYEPYIIGSAEIITLGASMAENIITFSGEVYNNPISQIINCGFVIQYLTSDGELLEKLVNSNNGNCVDFFSHSTSLYNLNLLFSDGLPAGESIGLGDIVYFRAFAENAYGKGYGLNRLYVIGSEGDGNKDLGGGDYNFVNSLTLIVCEGGTLIMDTLKVKNVSNLDINGTFYVNWIEGFATNTNCIFSSLGTGVIMSHSGESNVYIDGFQYGVVDENGNLNCSAQYSIQDTGIILPIDLISFGSDARPDRIDIKWITGTEINNDFFSIERSRDMNSWEVLGFVPGAGNSSVPLNYSFSDLRPLDGLAYYRLKQTDFDGQFKYYGPISAHYDLGMEGLDFKVLKQYTNWVIAVPNDGIYQVEVYNLMGHRLVSEKIENTLTIQAPEGAVVIRVTDGYARSASRVVM
jgi:hypothetical protein